ncbi:hypothetical protein [Shewanella sp. Isolate11]|uniref:hypothetical protein n=1 Tax=Shewanella sp. Isolate11 TaxID=2908530 RepID=UPI001EFD0C9A|nr:hypothetical protein [Shewanella sp. Isolate11]MCG9698244.1 hypothetical protein [Shewanella sp. Isolate11]
MKVFIFILSLFIAIGAQATGLVVGDKLQPIELENQHEQAIAVTSSTQIVLFSRGMKGGDIINQALETFGDKQPENLVYVADISGMPSLIAKFVAIPQMRDLPFNIALDREGEQTKTLPGDKASVTVIHLQQLSITKLTQVTDADALLTAIK